MNSTKCSKQEVNWTSYKGTIRASLEDLYDAFGDAHFFRPSSMEKVQIEWRLKFEDGTIATIYDWKQNGYIPYSDEIVEWNIGGHNLRAFELVVEAITANKSIL